MTLTIKPDLLNGACVLQGAEGDPEGAAVARASRTIPGYVTIVSSRPLGYAIRVPAVWADELARVPQEVPTCS